MPEITFDKILQPYTSPEEPGRVRIMVDDVPTVLVFGEGGPKAEVVRWVQAVYGEAWTEGDELTAIDALIAEAKADFTAMTAAKRWELVLRVILRLRRRGLI